MDMTSIRLTILFDGRFYVGIWERQNRDGYQVAREVFGSTEPTGPEVLLYICSRYHRLSFSAPEPGEAIMSWEKINPKRRQRLAARESRQGISTRSQQAMKAMREEQKEARKRDRRAEENALQEIRYIKKQEKRRQKKKGH